VIAYIKIMLAGFGADTDNLKLVLNLYNSLFRVGVTLFDARAVCAVGNCTRFSKTPSCMIHPSIHPCSEQTLFNPCVYAEKMFCSCSLC
jgi:hypothetical protein